MTIILKEVDKLEILTLQDNYIDVAAMDSRGQQFCRSVGGVLARFPFRTQGSDASLAEEIVTTFLTTDFEGGRHARRVDQITQLESDF